MVDITIIGTYLTHELLIRYHYKFEEKKKKYANRRL